MSGQTRHVVMFSGGLGSWMTAKRVAAEHGNLTLLFADVGSGRSPHLDGCRAEGWRCAASCGRPCCILPPGGVA